MVHVIDGGYKQECQCTILFCFREHSGTRLLTLFGFADVESVAMDSTIDPCENSDQAATLSYQVLHYFCFAVFIIY